MLTISSLLKFMQSQDPNGFWMEWHNEILEGESTLDTDYIITTLNEWYEDSNESKYLDIISQIIEAKL